MPSGAAAGAAERLREAMRCSVGGTAGRPLRRLRAVAAVPLDLTDPAVVADPYPSFARARAAAPVQWHDGLGLWLAFSHAEANAVLRDRRLGRIWADKTPADRLESFNLIHRNA